jgi:hypothetical protein
MNLIIFIFAFIGATSFHGKHGDLKQGVQGQKSAYFNVEDPDGSRQAALAAGINPDAPEELQAELGKSNQEKVSGLQSTQSQAGVLLASAQR